MIEKLPIDIEEYGVKKIGGITLSRNEVIIAEKINEILDSLNILVKEIMEDRTTLEDMEDD